MSSKLLNSWPIAHSPLTLTTALRHYVNFWTDWHLTTFSSRQARVMTDTHPTYPGQTLTSHVGCVWVMSLACQELKVDVMSRGKLLYRVRVRIKVEYWLSAVMVLYVFIITSSALVTVRGKTCGSIGAAEARNRQRLSPARVGVVSRSVWPLSSIDNSFSSFPSPQWPKVL